MSPGNGVVLAGAVGVGFAGDVGVILAGAESVPPLFNGSLVVSLLAVVASGCWVKPAGSPSFEPPLLPQAESTAITTSTTPARQ